MKPTPGQIRAQEVLKRVDAEMDAALADHSFPHMFPRWIAQLKSLEPLLVGDEHRTLLETIYMVERVAATHALLDRIFGPKTKK